MPTAAKVAGSQRDGRRQQAKRFEARLSNEAESALREVAYYGRTDDTRATWYRVPWYHVTVP